MDDNAWFISELNHDYAKFKKLAGEQDEAKKSLEKKEKKYEDDVRVNVKEATRGFIDTYAPIMTFRADEDQFLTHFPAELDKRVAQIAEVGSCTPADVLKVCLLDLGSFGAPGVATMDFAERVSAVTAGADGLSLFVCSETPAGKGRTLVGPSPKKPRGPDTADHEGAAEPAASGAVDSDLPSAPSAYHVYADKGAVRKLQMQHFEKVLQIGSGNTNRYAEAVTLKYVNKQVLRAVGSQPSANSVWQHCQLFRDLGLSGIQPPAEVVDIGPSTASKARQGLMTMSAAQSCVNRLSRNQRGPHLFSAIFSDVQGAADALSAEDGKRHPVLLVDQLTLATRHPRQSLAAALFQARCAGSLLAALPAAPPHQIHPAR